VIEQKSFRRVGGKKTIQSDVRIIAATNKDLPQAVQRGEFREDLYYRLLVFPIELPPLRERPEDLMPLAYLFLQQFNEECRKHVQGFTDAFEHCAHVYHWPGNVRELRNLIERAVILVDNDELIDPTHLPCLGKCLENKDEDIPLVVRLPAEGAALEAIEKEVVRQALELVQWNQVQAARLLDISRDALRYKMKKFGYLP
jgi:transcriptional regulator with PAS, ATPase and Fis domain